MNYTIGILIVLITFFAIQVLFILTCDYIDLKTLSILMLLHMSGTALSILLSGNGSIVVKCLIFLVTVIVIYSSSILTRHHCKKFKE